MKILITGGCGFLGSNLASAAVSRGDQVCIFDDLSRFGSHNNLEWLQREHSCIDFIHGDVSEKMTIETVISRFHPDAIFHLAGQVAMTTSIQAPYRDFQINTLGTLNILEAVRQHCPNAALIYASTNKVYGDLNHYVYDEGVTRYTCPDRLRGFDESEALNFHSPYGCSKGAADQYCLDYARIYGLRTLVLRHSSMYGGRQYATEDQGWVGWFCSLAARNTGQKGVLATISGNGKQVRDLLHADDATTLYFACLDALPRLIGKAFNVGGGIENSLSLIELFNLLEKYCDCEFALQHLPERASDQRIFVADTTALRKATGWSPSVSIPVGIAEMLAWCRECNVR